MTNAHSTTAARSLVIAALERWNKGGTQEEERASVPFHLLSTLCVQALWRAAVHRTCTVCATAVKREKSITALLLCHTGGTTRTDMTLSKGLPCLPIPSRALKSGHLRTVRSLVGDMRSVAFTMNAKSFMCRFFVVVESLEKEQIQSSPRASTLELVLFRANNALDSYYVLLAAQ